MEVDLITRLVAALAFGCSALDRTPPTLSVDAPSVPSQRLTFAIVAVDEVPGLRDLTVTVDGGGRIPIEVADDGTATVAPNNLTDGEHTFVFRATDRALVGNVRQIELVRTMDTTSPVVQIAPTSLTAHQGRTWALWVKANEVLAEVTATVALRDHEGNTAPRDLALFEVDGAWRALRGMEIEQSVGKVPLRVKATDPAGNATTAEAVLSIQSTAFEKGGFIRLTRRQKRARRDADAIARMREERNGAYAYEQPEQRWDAPFLLPVADADLTSPFGKYRTYSDGRRSFHTGLDLSHDRGVPVMAPAAGRVLVAGEQAIFGNVVILHHGQGVASSYNHLNSISVTKGDEVGPGDVLGTLGSTGQSTGPHLHWGVEVGVVAVDPSQWTREAHLASPF